MNKIQIEEIKRQGAAEALRKKLDDTIWVVKNRTLDKLTATGGAKYVRLQESLTKARAELEQVEELLKALNEIEPGHK